ncbi:Protein kinase C-like [Macleaya cordata]|uniref:Protein kinase C-like n=1 Tax=Macleaya cordata TaxID=56857 RepID=A0A200RCV7_MACCD|nr:Protein kinase C-like [Macleaya cordata]
MGVKWASSSSTKKHPHLRHFTHRHSLRLVSTAWGFKNFVCNGCGMEGSGLRYRCSSMCNWDLHVGCATCPEDLSTHIHPNHQLKLNWTKGTPNDQVKRGPCGACEEQVKGRFFYSCPSCDRHGRGSGFFLHPTCSRLPARLVCQLIDPEHPLTWQSAPPTRCTMCGDLCKAWRYRCGPCSIDVHLECVNTTTTTTRSAEYQSGGRNGKGMKKREVFKAVLEIVSFVTNLVGIGVGVVGIGVGVVAL